MAAYVLREAGGGPNWIEGRGADGNEGIILIGTGSELQLAFGAAEVLEREGHPTRVVSMPCWELFEMQDRQYRDAVLPPAVRARVSIEVGATLGWDRWVGDHGAMIGLDHFGASAPAQTIFEKFGFTTERVADVARRVLRGELQGRIPTLEPGHLPAGGALGRVDVHEGAIRASTAMRRPAPTPATAETHDARGLRVRPWRRRPEARASSRAHARWRPTSRPSTSATTAAIHLTTTPTSASALGGPSPMVGPSAGS